MKFLSILLSGLIVSILAIGQTTYPVNDVQRTADVTYYFTNANVQSDPETLIENATIVVKDGWIIDLGTTVSIPQGALVHDLKGKMVYPSFIDLDSKYGLSNVPKTPKKDKKGEQFVSKTKGAYNWNQAIRSEYNAADHFVVDPKATDAYLQNGFGAVLTHIHDGIARGTGALVLTSKASDHEMLISSQVSTHYSFKKGSSTQDYPGSLMGAIALMRQTQLDAEWYQNQNEEQNISLQAWNETDDLPKIFETNRMLDILRADALGDEIGSQFIIKVPHSIYRRVDEVKATKAPLIISLGFPIPYKIDDPFDERFVSLAELKDWELAPYQAAILEEAGVVFAITSADLKKGQKFLDQLRLAHEKGLSKTTALAALTSTPAKLIGANDVGSIKKGKRANFFIATDDLFNKESIILEHWVDGAKHKINDDPSRIKEGVYEITLGLSSYKVKLTNKANKFKISNESKEDKHKWKASLDGDWLSFVLTKGEEHYRFGGEMKYDQFNGKAKDSEGNWVEVKGEWRNEGTEEQKKEGTEEEGTGEQRKEGTEERPGILYPFVGYGNEILPKQQSILIQNITLWTNEDEGIIKNAYVLVKDGKIAKVSAEPIKEETDFIIEGTGKHLTAGIIDEHSHIAIEGGVNECTQPVTSEVNISDVINSESVQIYRALAGGVTGAQLLHGSCNPIGGRSGIVKWRWGMSPEGLKIKNTDPFIKFALGENVKRSNFGDHATKRFPQTRMGVEQIYHDAFTRALNYREEHDAWNNLSGTKKKSTSQPKRDLELEVLLEIMDSKRFISCHSYMQHEINMLMHVADSFGFTVNTFTHILEGYKVADKMKAHGAGGSTFSDWWAYKFEVNDAIPYNAALMASQGVVTAINSDDPEMGRRLNQEAAKAVKYGGVSEEEALKMVTLNPAKLLHLDDRTGSVKVGKDADLVVWSAHPLTIYAKAEYTMVDGVIYFDHEQDAIKRKKIQEEKQRIIKKMMAAGKKGPSKKVEPKEEKIWHCTDVE